MCPFWLVVRLQLSGSVSLRHCSWRTPPVQQRVLFRLIQFNLAVSILSFFHRCTGSVTHLKSAQLVSHLVLASGPVMSMFKKDLDPAFCVLSSCFRMKL